MPRVTLVRLVFWSGRMELIEMMCHHWASHTSACFEQLHFYNVMILLSIWLQGHVVLTDFGLCKEGISGRKTTSTFCGTPEVRRVTSKHLCRRYQRARGSLKDTK